MNINSAGTHAHIYTNKGIGQLLSHGTGGHLVPKTCKTLAAGGQEGMVWLARVSRRFRVGGEVIGCRGFASQA